MHGMFLFTKVVKTFEKEGCVWAEHIASIEVCNILVETRSRNRSPGLKCGLDNTSVKVICR